jgi:hypothetical protein
MPTPARFRYSFKTQDNTQWYYIDNGVVKLSATEKYFTDKQGNDPVSPKEWANTEVGLSRDEKYYGVFTKFTIPITFTYEAAILVKNLFAIHGYEGTAIFIIERCDDLTWAYSEMYRCEIDLSAIKTTDYKDKGVTVTGRELSISTDLVNNQDIVYEIPFDSDALTINNDGIILNFKYGWVGGGTPDAIVYQQAANSDFYIDAYPTGADDNVYINKFVFPSTQIATTNESNNTDYILYTDVSGDFLLEAAIDIKYDYLDSSSIANSNVAKLGVFIEEFLYTPTGFNKTEHRFFLDPVGVTANGLFAQPRRVAQSIIGYRFPMVAGHTYKLSVKAISASNADIVYSVYVCDVRLSGATRLPATDTKSYPYLTFLNKLFKQALGSSVNVLSEYFGNTQPLANNFDTPGKWTTVTSGDALRKADNPKIKTSITEAFKDMMRWGIGLAVEGKNIRVEPLKTFFDKDTVIYTVDNVQQVKISVASQFLGNIIKTGYNGQTYDDLNGKEDFFNTSNWTFPTRRINTEIDWISPYYASPWAIEYARTYALTGRDSTDSQYDNQTYLIDVEATPTNGKYNILRRQNATGNFLTGIANPSSCYNLGLTPANVLYLNSAYLLSISYGDPINNGSEIIWQTSDKNSEVTRKLDSYQIAENGNIKISKLLTSPTGDAVDPLFQPIIFEIDTALPISLFDMLAADPTKRYGVIRFPYSVDGVFKGYLDMFLLDAVFHPATNDVYTLRGLSSPTNNLNIL